MKYVSALSDPTIRMLLDFIHKSNEVNEYGESTISTLPPAPPIELLIGTTCIEPKLRNFRIYGVWGKNLWIAFKEEGIYFPDIHVMK